MGYNEADTRAKLINPKLHEAGWSEDLIRREITAGTVEIISGKTIRKKGRMDYLLCLPVKEGKNPLSIAVLEAKKEDEHATLGLEQAKEYAKRLNAPFVFSTNGHLFVEYDYFEEKVSREFPLENFPAPETLRELYEKGKGFSLDDEKAKALLVPYRGGQSERRYYQDAALRAALEKIASKKDDWNRVLLSLATGSGKTRIAVQLLHKLAESNQLKNALFVCDRNELRRQGFGKLFAAFGDNAAEVKKKNPQKNARIVVATYQALGIDEEGDQSFFLDNYPKNYFSHIIIDECHRSAWNKWSIVLTNNPVAACEIVKRKANIDDKMLLKEEIIEKGAYDARTGKPMLFGEGKEVYEKSSFDRQLILPDRRKEMCKDVLEQFEKTGGLKQKTIIFCVNDKHAEDVTNELNNKYKEKGLHECEKFAFKFTQKGVASGVSFVFG
jgi:type I restriction enzyme R subunit